MVAMAARKVSYTSEATGTSQPSESLGPAYENVFVEALEPALEDLACYGIKVVVNAGGSDTEGLYNRTLELIQKKNLQMEVAWISGDEVLPTIKRSMAEGKLDFQNIYTDDSLALWDREPIYAQAYIGGLGISEALRQGAQIVICGRVADASPVIGAAYWFHDWKRTDLDKLANAFVAGHLIECSTYVCGGNFSGFEMLEKSPGGWSDIGFPIAEISHDGKVIITKQQNTAGMVTVDTCSSQLLYEIQGPHYFNSDVVAYLPNVVFEQIGPDRVALHGVTGLPPPPTTKVGITALGGYQAEASWFLTGLDTAGKARMLEAQLRRNLLPYSNHYTKFNFSVLGSALPDSDSQNAATAIFRIFVQARDSHSIAPHKFLRPILDNIMQGYPGATFHLDTRQGIPKPYYDYFVTLLSQSSISHRVHLSNKSTPITISPPPLHLTRTYLPRQPSQHHTAVQTPLSTFGPTKRAPLGLVAHSRSGDKGPDCNCGFWVLDPAHYTWLRNLLSIPFITQLLGREYDPHRRPKIEIERFELPNMRAVHFLFRNLLEGTGVSSTGSVDFLGKNVAEFLRSRWVDVPVKFLEGRPRL